MPIHIGWLIENRVSYFRYKGDITVEELEQASQIGLDLIEQCDAPLLHTIQDNTAMTSFPNNAAVLLKTVRSSLMHPRMGWMISVSIQNKLTRQLSGLVSQITRTRHRIVETTTEAIEFLNYVDSTLPDLSSVEAPANDAMLYHISSSTNASPEEA
jgi:hypothetical protein